jgi:amino acid transporter
MSLLILAVGWAYTQICRIYPDGGGVYTAAKQKARLLGVIGALLLFADYTVTASLSALDAFHYFGLGQQHQSTVEHVKDAGDRIQLNTEEGAHNADNDEVYEPLWAWNSPGLWAIVAIGLIGAFNLLGPKHSSRFAVFAALGMVAITLLVVAFALPQIHWSQVEFGSFYQPPGKMWEAFVGIVLALSGVEAIANLTGVMKKPVYITAKKSIGLVAAEVALFNLLLAFAMLAIPVLSRSEHSADMLAFMAGHYVGNWGEWPVRIIGGTLLLSATNTAVNGLMSIVYVMSRDGEMPAIFQRLNGWGAPWVGAMVAAAVPALVLVIAHDLETLASLYAMGVVGAVAINCSLCTFHPRLRKFYRKFGMAVLALVLIAIWITLAFTKWHATVFVSVVLVCGLTLRLITRSAAKRTPKQSLLRRAIVEQLSPEAMAKPRILMATAGSARLAEPAIQLAKAEGAALVVAFIRAVALSYKVEAENVLTLDTDPAALAMFTTFLDLGHKYSVPIIPMYDTGPDPAVLLAEHAAIHGCERVLIGTSRRGMLHHLIRGSFQRKLEALLPPEIPVEVIQEPEPAPQTAAAAEDE